MNAKEIIDKFKSILLSTDAVEAPEVKEEIVELAEKPVEEQAPVEEMPHVAVDFATKTELAEAVAQFKAMFEQLTDAIKQDERKDVPEELSKETVQEFSIEVEPITHSPEVEVAKERVALSQNRAITTLDRVMSRLSNK